MKMGDRFPPKISHRLLAALLACACSVVAATAWAATTVTIHAGFSPNKAGAPTNVSATAKLVSTTGGPPVQITGLTFYAPAGMTVDVRGTGTCTAAKLEAHGPSGCPANSRAGFGSGIAVSEIANTIGRERFTLDFFFAPKENGRLAILIYLNGVSPNAVELVFVAKEIQAPKPYGLGFSVEVPPVLTLPGAPNASLESLALTFGAANVAYYKKVHGKKKLLHVKGAIIPKRCPSGGFPLAAKVDFADGTTSTVKTTISCPRR